MTQQFPLSTGDPQTITAPLALSQALYGPPKEARSRPEKRPTTRRPLQKPPSGEDPILCSDAAVDALITAGSQKQTYVFKGAYYWRLTDAGVEKGYPRLISQYWKGVPDDIDAAFSWPQTNRIYFFKVRWRNEGGDVLFHLFPVNIIKACYQIWHIYSSNDSGQCN